MNISCNVILDLIPLVKDGVASDESTSIVNEHIKNCESCKVEFDFFEIIKLEQPLIKDAKIIFDIKRSIFITQIIILIIGAIVGVALSNSMGMFYNFIIMPIIGSIAFITFKRKGYLAAIAVFIISYLWQTIANIILGGFEWTALYSGLFYSIIYALLVVIGVIIAMLLKFVFKKGDNMKSTINITLKMLVGVVAVALIGIILFVTNSFVGNPISAMMANKAIKQYVGQNYSYLDLEIGKASYSFKDGSYMARAKSKTSIDTKFFICYRNGKIQRDDYESYVLGMFNTLDRLSDEYSAVAKNIIAKELGYENNTTMVMFNKDEYENVNNILELDMKFDKALPIQTEVTIKLDLADNSLEGIAKVLTDAHKAFVDNDCNFNLYDLYAENDGKLIMVNGVTSANIESGDLANLLERAKNNDGVNGIRVFIKEAKK